MRKRLIEEARTPAPGRDADELDLASMATVLVTSEAPDHPVEGAFDGSAGPGASRWVAATPGEQTLVLQFDAPQLIRRVQLEIQEHETPRTQEMTLSASSDGGQMYRELVRQEYTFSPPHTTVEREDWSVTAPGTTHLRLHIKPDKGSRPGRASVTSLRVW
jgi:hypothetical protein